MNANFAYKVGQTLTVPRGQGVTINANIGTAKLKGGVKVKVVRVDRHTITLSQSNAICRFDFTLRRNGSQIFWR